ncbi:hypothetical protein DNL40_00745 [Xylanimonas oleitrophica]|uniref:DUF4190 domain-containing protein n=1 Tax=Xylanimonas oleitrophica TaxID=2607479 RepID=A0A2W5YIN0_9MICO|nr:DUF4190 domain-containing protein [Xylanimonas oleitrophica]PZR54961.1 hypothetical protein DNL40_00745 [Xylanimonas oleitrophica]
MTTPEPGPQHGRQPGSDDAHGSHAGSQPDGGQPSPYGRPAPHGQPAPADGGPPADGRPPSYAQPPAYGQPSADGPGAGYGATGAPPYGQQPYPAGPGQAAPADPGRGLGIAGFVLALLGPLTVVGLVVSIVALIRSRKAGRGNGFAVAGIVLGAIGTVLLAVAAFAFVVGLNQYTEMCNDLGPGTHQVDGISVYCQ